MKKRIINKLKERDQKEVQKEILEGLTSRPRSISPKFFYDAGGSRLFESITGLEEYYPTRTEKAILSGLANQLELDFQDLNIVELGSGDPSKIRLLLQQIPEENRPSLHYYPVDISRSALEDSMARLAEEFPEMEITGIVADFMHQFNKLPKVKNRLFCFLGSTIGNLTPEERTSFMQNLAKEMKAGDNLLLGLDMVKDPQVLHSAYNDSKQVTAAFNKNVLKVMNEMVDSSFETSDFEHLAFYNQEEQRIEMHLKALRDRKVRVNGQQTMLDIKKGETIHTENSYKFKEEDIFSIGALAGLHTKIVFSDEKKWFSLVLYGKKH
jgi:L-histidine N-alpha-methyltransferase